MLSEIQPAGAHSPLALLLNISFSATHEFLHRTNVMLCVGSNSRGERVGLCEKLLAGIVGACNENASELVQFRMQAGL